MNEWPGVSLWSTSTYLCPIDFSEFSRHALMRAVAVAKAHRASVMALHVVPSSLRSLSHTLKSQNPRSSGWRIRHVNMCCASSRNSLPRSIRCVYQIDTDVVDAETVHGEILAQAERLRADLVVMGAHGRTGFQRLLLGSVTDKVLRAARQPVLTVGAPAGEQNATSAFKRIFCAIDFSECSIAALTYAVSLADRADPRLGAVNVIEWTPIGYDPLGRPPLISRVIGWRRKRQHASDCKRSFAIPRQHSRSRKSSRLASRIMKSCASRPNIEAI